MTFKGLELSMDDVVILDVCPLLSDVWLRCITEKEKAIKEAYELIEDILVLLKPELVISCQCATKSLSSHFGKHASEFAQELGSSWLAAEQKQVVRFQYREYVFNIVKAFRPRSFMERDGKDAHRREALLKETLTHFLAPCGKWKARIMILLQLEKMFTAWLEAITEMETKLDRFSDTLERFTGGSDNSVGSGLPVHPRDRSFSAARERTI
jgi:hypothetical protein